MTPISLFRCALIAAALSTALALAGCGGGSSAPSAGDVTISHLANAYTHAGAKMKMSAGSNAPLPDNVDAMQIEFFDDAGRSVMGPVEVDSDPVVTVRNVPLTASSTTVHYLRNGGYALAKDDEPIAWNGLAGSASPTPASVGASFTRWKTSVDENGVASVSLSSSQVNGGSPQDILLKGVAYSPNPVGASSEFGPGFGDLFWDTPRPRDFIDNELIWKRDLEAIRAKGFNSVRVYSLIANFIMDSGAIPTPEQIADANQLRYREHKKFLDAAWNNGVNPIYVLAGVPMPDNIWIKSVSDNPAYAASKVYWDNNFTATLTQLKDHPAVIGFTMFNEQGGASDYAEGSAGSQHYWSQIQKYSERAKAIAPDKLIGWAFFDDIPFANGTISLRRTHAKSIDFYGVNAFQPTDVAPSLDPWKKIIQGDTARPVFMTEFGIPVTGRRNGDSRSIYADPGTVQKAADSMARMLPLVFQHPAVAGMFYFEWSDEWWKQAGTPITSQDGGGSAPHFPNGWYDEEGFGLHSIALGDRAINELYGDQLWKKGANIQVDRLTPRAALADAVTKAYGNAERDRRSALGL